MRRIVVLVLSLAFAGVLPAQQKRVYIANDDHTDYMWTTGESGYRQAFLEMLDYYLNLADSTAGKAADYRSRFNTDGSFWVRTYEQNRTAAKFARLINRIKDGSISVPLTLLNLCYGAMPAEAVLRSMYYAGRLERQYGLSLKLALCQENQTLPFGLGTLFAGAGASYFWKGICSCATKVYDASERPHDMYWWTGLDGSRLLTKWNSMIRHDYYDIGGYAEARKLPDVIDFVLSDATFKAHHPYHIIGLFGYGGDDLKTFTDLFVRTAQAESTAGVRVIVSNTVDFFQDFAATYGSTLPSQSLSFGNEWDILSASMSELSARVKRAAEKLRAAEALAAYVNLRDPSFMQSRKTAAESAWIDLGMYYDHDWTADGSAITRHERAAWQRERAAGIESYVSNLLTDAKTALGGMIYNEATNPRYFVFNPLGWARTDAADLPHGGTGAVHVLDVSTGLEVPSQRVTVDGTAFLRVWAEDIPPLGYKTFEVVSGAGASFGGGPAADADAGSLENAFYRLLVGTNGAIVSLIDKLRGNREMVKASGGRFLNDLGSGSGTIAIENAGPVSATLRIESSGPLSHETAVTLYRDSARIDINNEILQNFGDVRTWDFGLNLDAPLLRHEEIGAVLLARIAADGGHYAPTAARYDWITLNHFADLSAGGTGLTISSPDLSFMRRGSSAPKFLDVATPQLSILAGGQVDGASLGIPNQGGDESFRQRFGLQTHGDFNAVEAMRVALEHQNPLEAGRVTGGTSYPADAFSLFSCTAPGTFVWAVKPAEDTTAGGIVVRLWNQASAATGFDLVFDGFTVTDAKQTSLVETPLAAASFQPNRVSASIPGFGWRAYHLKLNGNTVPVALALTSPNGGETLFKGRTHTIAWTTIGSIPDVKLEYSTDNGASWTTVIASTPNTGSFVWTVPAVVTAAGRMRISDPATGRFDDTSNAAFSIVEAVPLVLTSPNGGEIWSAGTTQGIAWMTDGTVAEIKLEYSINGGGSWTMIAGPTPAVRIAASSYAWVIPTVASTNCLVRISEAATGTPSDASDAAFTIKKDKPVIGLGRTSLNFAKIKGGALTPAEKVALTNPGSGTLAWKAAKSAGWISVMPARGTGNAMLTVKMVNLFSLAAGTYTGAVTITDPAAANSPETVEVALTVKGTGTDAVPFGAFEMPADGSSFGASIALSGWALDDVAMRAVKIFRKTGEKTKTLIGKAAFIAGARPDIETAYSSYPQNNRAGWTFTLKASSLPGGGAGAFVIQAYAVDNFGHNVLLSEKTLTGTGAAGSPGPTAGAGAAGAGTGYGEAATIGEIETPKEGGIAAGSAVEVSGWAPTPLPGMIEENGLTLWIDGMAVEHMEYGKAREDIAARAGGSYLLDTTKYADGWHTIAWSATDSSGIVGEIGSRYFRIQNKAPIDKSAVEALDEEASLVIGEDCAAGRPVSEIAAFSEGGRMPVYVKRGFSDAQTAEAVYPGTDGAIRIELPQASRLAIYLDRAQTFENGAEQIARAEINLAEKMKEAGAGTGSSSPSRFSSRSRYQAYAEVGDELRPLPIGASFDANDGIFYWQPGPGFLGEHRFAILDTEASTRRAILITIE